MPASALSCLPFFKSNLSRTTTLGLKGYAEQVKIVKEGMRLVHWAIE